MNTERWQSIKELFERVRLTPEAERASVLTLECGGDPELRAEVEELLARDSAVSPLDDPPAALGLPTEPASTLNPHQLSTPPTTIGRFRILSVLGAGTYGIVYFATDETNGQTLALKVLRTSAPSADMRRRFEYEAQAITELSHPCVARIYEAATVISFDGAVTPHIAMEFIDGVPITEYARVHQFSQAQVLNLILQACDGVAHAHQRGIIHRDLKPSNVLVDLTGAVKILDFGLAKFIEREGSSTGTVDGQLLGTPAYMSPEQASGNPDRIDTRSDVYSLGAILYELLGHRPPLVVGSLGVLDAVRVIEKTEPPPLGSIAAACRGDLETIVGKALAKEPVRRYQTVLEFASDIRRFMAEEPVLARPASLGYVLRKFARRHRPFVGALFVLAIAAIIAVAAILAGQREAAKGHQIARELASTLLTRVIGPNWERIGTVEERRSLLFEIRDRVEQFASRYPDDATMQLDYARLLGRLTDQAESDGDKAGVLSYANQTLAVYQRLAAANPDDADRQTDLSIATVRAGDAAGSQGLHDAQDLHYQQAYQIDLALHKRHPDSSKYLNNLAFSHERLAFRAEAAGNLPEATKHARQELELAEVAMQRWPDEAASRWLRASSRASLGVFLHKSRDHTAGTKLGRLAKEDFDVLAAEHPENRRYAIAAASTRIGLADAAPPNDPEALVTLNEAAVIMNRLCAEDPGDSLVQEMRFWLELQRLDRSGRGGDEQMFHEALRGALASDAILSRGDPHAAGSAFRRARILIYALKIARAFEDSAMASRLLDEATSASAELCAGPEANAESFDDYAWLLLIDHEHPSPEMIACGVVAAGRAIVEGTKYPYRPVLALAFAQWHQGRFAEARAMLERAFALVNPELEPEAPPLFARIRAQWSDPSCNPERTVP